MVYCWYRTNGIHNTYDKPGVGADGGLVQGVPEPGLYGDVVVDLLQALPEHPAVAGFYHVGEHGVGLDGVHGNWVSLNGGSCWVEGKRRHGLE